MRQPLGLRPVTVLIRLSKPETQVSSMRAPSRDTLQERRGKQVGGRRGALQRGAARMRGVQMKTRVGRGGRRSATPATAAACLRGAGAGAAAHRHRSRGKSGGGLGTHSTMLGTVKLSGGLRKSARAACITEREWQGGEAAVGRSSSTLDVRPPVPLAAAAAAPRSSPSSPAAVCTAAPAAHDHLGVACSQWDGAKRS